MGHNEINLFRLQKQMRSDIGEKYLSYMTLSEKESTKCLINFRNFLISTPKEVDEKMGAKCIVQAWRDLNKCL